MDYIDWLISSFIFLITVSLILVAISSIIPINPNDNSLSKSIFVSTVENVPVYNFYVNNTETEVIPFSFTLENLDGVSQNLFAIDGNNYFGVIQNDNRFFNYTITSPEEPKGIQVLKESFNDFDYSDNFAIVPDANINAGILVLENPSTITSNNSYYDYLGFLSTTNIVTAYISYTDVNNNYFCRFSDSTITIGKTEESTQTILKTTSYSKTTDWHRVFFGYTKDNLINCNAGDTETSYQDSNTISKTQVVISTAYNNTLVDDVYIYLNNDLESSSGTIIGNYIDANITNNLITIKTMDNALSSTLDFNFSEGLVVTDGNGISLVKSSEQNKLLFFPQTKEFWSYKSSGETLEINLDENTGFDLDISEIEDLVLWLDASSLELNDNDLVESWTDLSGNNNHATQSEDGNKPTFKENILNGKPIIKFNNSALITPTFSFLDWTIFVLFNDQSATTTYERILDHSYINGFWFGRNGSSANSWGGGVKEGSPPYGRFISIMDTQWHIIQNIRSGETHTISSGSSTVSGTVTANVTTSNTIGIGSWQTQQTSQRATDMDIAEILIYNSALSDSNRLLVENYLSQKYNVDVNNGLSFTNNYIELINLNDNSKIIKFEFFDKETNKSVDCNYEYKNKKITINSCKTDVVIKTRFRLNGVASFPEYPNISITKTKEQMITKEKLESLSNQDYYIKVINKIITLENIENTPSKKIYKNFSKLLHENGFIEEVVVEVKSFT